MSIDTSDPNEPENHVFGGELPSKDENPATEKAEHLDLNHPSLMVLGKLLKRMPLIERWTILEDVICGTVEFRIVLGKRQNREAH